LLKRGSVGEDVRTVQRLLLVTVDGIFGPATETAVKVFQRASGLAADGVVGPLTWEALDKLEEVPRPIADGGGEDEEADDDDQRPVA
jgi:murein L,D-transpeptidase YcbB/YkuD